MKVILLEEVKGQGREGDIVDVARGFAVNYLFPRKMAVAATSGNVKQLEARKGNIAKREDARRSEAEQLAAAIEGKTVTIEAKAGEEGRLFGSVTATMVADAIAGQLGVEVDRRRMDVHGHIKTLGSHPVTVQVHHDVKAELTVNVIPEGGVLTPAAPAPQAVEEPAVEEPAGEEPAAEGEGAENAESDEDRYEDVADDLA